ncbi:hypothetical protein GALMADRAFT_90809 [Galerina marginata CBS 339.88]|uniref:Cytochrome P450 n=1 Tax=Galerina marginata (strain CBS 339.88) TaxID=685588 RepID=A0A067TQL4_GALM3|nr:hypothetical protein GALMADRAFT_90809 [Galerina marginata CBS 339.88]
MPSYTSLGAAVLLIWLVKKFIDSRSNHKHGLPFPPGPKPKPLIGNLTDLPITNAAQTYAEWEKKYHSNILHAAALGNRVVVLNNREDAEALLDKRASNYSDRPVIPITEM